MAQSDVGNAWGEGAGYMSNNDALEYERIKVLLTQNRFYGSRNVNDIKVVLDRAGPGNFKVGLIKRAMKCLAAEERLEYMRTKNNSRPKTWDNNLKICKEEVHRLDATVASLNY